MANGLFFIAIIPPGEITREIHSFKELCAERFGSSRALNSPPHVTLVPPFRMDKSKLIEIQNGLSAFVNGENRFYLSLKDFFHFGNKVIFVNVEKDTKLHALYARLNKLMAKLLKYEQSGGKKFHPHITIAFRDLNPQNFILAWKHFDKVNYERIWAVDALVLLKHNGKRWEIERKFPFKNN